MSRHYCRVEMKQPSQPQGLQAWADFGTHKGKAYDPETEEYLGELHESDTGTQMVLRYAVVEPREKRLYVLKEWGVATSTYTYVS